MTEIQTKQTQIASQKAKDAIALVQASLTNLKPYDPEKFYDPTSLEPYDALNSRFSRAVEMSIKFFRSYEKLMFAENSETLRDLLNRMEKLELISSTFTWMKMRDVRNRIVNDYLPEDIKIIYDSIMKEFNIELQKVLNKVKTLSF